MPLISPTTLFVAGSISMTLSPAALVWMIRTVAAPTARVVTSGNARIRESLVFIATHSKLCGHVVDLLFCRLPGADLAGARFYRFQGVGPAAPHREAAGTCPVHHLPLDRHRVPADPASSRPRGLHRGRIAE